VLPAGGARAFGRVLVYGCGCAFFAFPKLLLSVFAEEQLIFPEKFDTVIPYGGLEIDAETLAQMPPPPRPYVYQLPNNRQVPYSDTIPVREGVVTILSSSAIPVPPGVPTVLSIFEVNRTSLIATDVNAIIHIKNVRILNSYSSFLYSDTLNQRFRRSLMEGSVYLKQMRSARKYVQAYKNRVRQFPQYQSYLVDSDINAIETLEKLCSEPFASVIERFEVGELIAFADRAKAIERQAFRRYRNDEALAVYFPKYWRKIERIKDNIRAQTETIRESHKSIVDFLYPLFFAIETVRYLEDKHRNTRVNDDPIVMASELKESLDKLVAFYKEYIDTGPAELEE
jgi:hypothetical protein